MEFESKNCKRQKVNINVIVLEMSQIMYKRFHLASFPVSQRAKTVLPSKWARIRSRQ